MKPIQMTHDICRYYLDDQVDADPALVAKARGFHRARDIARLASCSSLFDAAQHTIKDWRFLRQIEAFYKKNTLFVNPTLCAGAAQASFDACEEQCSATNRRLRDKVSRPHLLGEENFHLISRMKHYISNVLGDYPVFLERLPFLVRVTPGATSTANRRNSLPQLKMRMKLFCTKRATRYVKALYHLYGFREPRIMATPTNRVELVPKNWKTDRTIACEPEGNLPLQLAFDTHAKRRLRHFGIDLRNQSANAELARHASIHNDYVTVDFSAASDTISYNTVAMLFPSDWFAYLDDVRAPMYRGAFGRGVYAKFSSMGNGSTFTIETLIFAAACYAVCGNRDFLVYGDDVILPRANYDAYVQLTRLLGFTVNEDKSFSDGPFRESCGGDYFNGVDVTPVFLRGLNRRKATLCHVVNTLMTLTFPGSALAAYLRSLIGEFNLPFVPVNESTMSGVWLDPNIARAKGLIRRKKGQVDEYKAYIPSQGEKPFVDSRGYYLWFLMKNSQVLFSGPWGEAYLRPTTTSSVPTFRHKYVRKWVRWVKPPMGIPDHLIWVTEQVGPR